MTPRLRHLVGRCSAGLVRLRHPDWGSRIRTDLLFAGVASGLFLSVLFIYGPINVEQYHHSHPSVRVFQRALFDGRFLFWSSSFGLGTPLPLGENNALHPLFMLEPLISLRWVFRLFWWLHLSVGSFFLIRLCRQFDIARSISRVVALTYIVSPVTLNYSYADDWPASFLAWSLLPFVVLLALQVGDRTAGRSTWRPIALLTLLLAFLIYNSHLGYLFTWAIPVAIFLVVATGPSLGSLVRFGTVALLGVVIASERLYHVLHEARLFPSSIENVTQAPVTWKQWFQQLYRPFDAGFLAELGQGDLSAAILAVLENMAAVRVPFLGLVFSGAAVWGVVAAIKGSECELRKRRLRALAAAFIVSLVFSTIPAWSFLQLNSGMWVYRDPALLFGALLAGASLTAVGRRRATRRLLAGAMVIQCVQSLLVAAPPIEKHLRHRYEGVQFYAGGRAPEFASWVAAAADSTSPRVAISPKVGRILMEERTDLAALGFLAVGDLVPLGIRPLNGYFKNVSMDAVYPSFKLMGGMIGTDPEILQAATNLDVLSVDYLLAMASERSLAPADFEPVRPTLPLAGGEALQFFRNPDAWPLANLFDSDVLSLDLQPYATCGLPGVLCTDLSPLIRYRTGLPVALRREEDRFEIDVEPGDVMRVVVTSLLHRPEWRARSGEDERLRVHAIAGALLAVEVPPTVTRIRLAYRPWLRMALLWTGGFTALVLLLIGVAAPHVETDGRAAKLMRRRPPAPGVNTTAIESGGSG